MGRTRDAPLGGHGWQSRLGRSRRSSLGAEWPSAATVARPNGYSLETRDAACDGRGWPKVGHRGMTLPLLGSMRGYRLKKRKGMPGWRSRGWSGGSGAGDLRRAFASSLDAALRTTEDAPRRDRSAVPSLQNLACERCSFVGGARTGRAHVLDVISFISDAGLGLLAEIVGNTALATREQ
jgi:hypothetical protein